MKLYHVDPNAYGTFGSIVIADNKKRAKEIFCAKMLYDKKANIKVTLLTNNLQEEFVQDEMVE